eukprot:m.169335 g.169335  ORF g.169335 m.169335 type:complete len:83 (+) comp38984_c1_seq12:142-390(+)
MQAGTPRIAKAGSLTREDTKVRRTAKAVTHAITVPTVNDRGMELWDVVPLRASSLLVSSSVTRQLKEKMQIDRYRRDVSVYL